MFKDTVPQPIITPSLPVEAMNFNGHFLEDLIPGYRTLSVSGREVISTDINSFKVNIQPGKWVSTTTLPERVLRVRFQLRSDSPYNLMRLWVKLNKALSSSDFHGVQSQNVPIWFNDDPEVVYYGMKYEMDLPPEGVLFLTSTFSIFCSDPTKYSKSMANDVRWGSKVIEFRAPYLLGDRGSGADSLMINSNTDLPTFIDGEPVRPEITLSGEAKDLILSCNGQAIRVGTFSGSVKIDTSLMVIYRNGVEGIPDMDDFWLNPNSSLRITGSSMNFTITLDYRRAYI